MKFLIVENDPASILLLRIILEKYGTSDEAATGRQALELHESAMKDGNPYDAIFLDLMLPDISGQHVLKSIRDRERTWRIPDLRTAKVIMATALDDAENVSQAFCEGRASAYLVKPILRNAVIEEMQKLQLL